MYTSLNSRICLLEVKLDGVDGNQWSEKLNDIREKLKECEYLESLVNKLQAIGVYNEVPIDDNNGNTTTNLIDSFQLKELVLSGYDDLTGFANQLDQLIEKLNVLDNFKDSFNKINEAQFNKGECLERFIKLQESFNLGISKSIKLLELQLIHTYKQNQLLLKFYSKRSNNNT